jgi:chromosome segregation ATPase
VTDSYWRFRFLLPPNKTTRFLVRQRDTLSRTVALSTLSNQELTFWVEQRYLDAPTEQALRQLVELRQQLAALQHEVEELERESNAIHKEQERIRGNLQALGDRSAEKELRDRLVRTLGAQEDRLEQIVREVNDRKAAAARHRAAMGELLGRLEYEADV